MKLKFELAGTLNITADKIDIADPCYDKSVWCRITRPIIPGDYNCYVGKGYNKRCGERVYMLVLLSADVKFNGRGYTVESTGTIGVDAGLAGFFIDKPDYTEDDWVKICDFVFDESETGKSKKYFVFDENSPMRCKGFFSESGIGDGVYDVYSISKKNKLVGYKLEF